MEKICDSYSTGALYDFVSRSENLEEYRNILESLADQKQNWTYIINDIMKERGLSASKMAELCGVSRQSVQKWLKGSVPKSRETYIKIGFAAHYNLKQMNYFLQRYGCVNKLYPKYLEDSVCIFVLSSDCIEHSYQACEKVINMIKNEIFDDVPRSEGKEYTTSALELDITNLRSLQEMVSFVKEHAQMYNKNIIDYIVILKIVYKKIFCQMKRIMFLFWQVLSNGAHLFDSAFPKYHRKSGIRREIKLYHWEFI